MRCVYMSPSVLTGSLHDTRPLEGNFKTFLRMHTCYTCIKSLIFLVFFVSDSIYSEKAKMAKNP